MKTQGGSPGRLGQRKPFQTAAISSSASQGDSRQTWYRVQLQRGKDQLSHHRGCLRLNPEKTLVLIGVCCSEGLRVPRACGSLGCVVAEAELQLLGSCFTRCGAGRRAESPPHPLLRQRAGMRRVERCHSSPGCQAESPARLSEAWDGKQTVCIRLLRLGCLGVRGAWHCAPLSSPNAQCTSTLSAAVQGHPPV